MNIVISGGGTGGHLYPAINIAQKLQNEFNDVNIIYIGKKNSIEEEIVKQTTNFTFISIDIEGLKGLKKFYQNFRVLSKFKKASILCQDILKKYDVKCVIGTGGYVCAPVFSAAKKLNINYYIHEQNCVFGKVVKFYLPKSKATFTSFDKMLNLDLNKYSNVIFAGNPQSKVATQIKNVSKIKDQVLIYSGSMGGYYFNENIVKLYPKLAKLNLEFIHIVGKNHEIQKHNFNNIKVLKYSSNLLELINESKFVICRSGASTIAELIGLSKPAILVPSPYVSHNHQYINATYLTQSNCCEICEEKNMEINLLNQINEMNSNTNKYIHNYQKIDIVDSLDIIVKKIWGDLHA